MKPSFFQIGIILLFSTILLFPSHAFSENIKGTEDEKLKLKEKFIELKSKAQERDTIPVIIGLNTDFKAEGKLIDSKINIQKNKIKQDQDSLIGFLSSYKIDNIYKFKHISAIAMNVDKKSLERLELSPLVAMISEDVLFESFLTQSVPLVGAPAAWSNGASGLGQAVAILDTGVEKTHSMLFGKVISEACFSSTVTNPQSITVCPGGGEEEIGVDTGVPCSVNGCDHGTHVAGIAAGNGVGISGVAKDANIIAIQVFSKFPDTGFCNSKNLIAPCVLAYTSDIVKGLDHVMTLSNTLDISSVNLSLGGGEYTSESACDADPFNFFLKQSADNLRSVGIATIASSGNKGFTDSLGSPACISSIISVGSTTKQDVVSGFSNSASFLDFHAPGSSITSSILNNQLGSKSGTSFSVPHVAGAWAILKSAVPGASVDDVLNSLKNTGVSITDTRNGLIFPRIQVDSALNDLLPLPPDITPPIVSIWKPRAGNIVIDTTKISIYSIDGDPNPVNVCYSIDGVELECGLMGVGKVDIHFFWDTTTYSDGSHSIDAISCDASGNCATASTVTVVVDNIGVDTTPPTVSIWKPRAGNTVIDTTKISIYSIDGDPNPVNVCYSIDGVELECGLMGVGKVDIHFFWDTTTYSDGSHSIDAISCDASGNCATASTVTVVVDNIP